MKKLLFAVFCGTIGAAWCETLTWKGGTDAKWSTAANWESDGTHTRPENGDSLVLTATSVNDLGSAETPLQLGKVTVDASAPIRLSGNPVSFATEGTIWENKSEVTNALDIVIPAASGTFKFTSGSQVKFIENGDITSSGATVDFTFNDPGLECGFFNGDIRVGSGQIHFHNKGWGYMRLRGVLACSSVGYPAYSNDLDWDENLSYRYIYNPANSVKTYAMFRHGVYCCAANVLTNAVITFGYYCDGKRNNFYLNGYDQTIDRFTDYNIAGWRASDGASSMTCQVCANGNERLTLRATDNCDFYSRFANNLKLVWAPVGKYTFKTTMHEHQLVSPIIVSNGTFSVASNARFPKLTGVEVASGATFSLSSTNGTALAELKEIRLHGTGTFKVTAAVTTPFTDGLIAAYLDDNAIFNLASGVTMNVGGVRVGNTTLAAGYYTGGATDGITNHVDWISGDGVLHNDGTAIPYTWTGAACDHLWSTVANWDAGAVPSANADVILNAADAVAITNVNAVLGASVTGSSVLSIHDDTDRSSAALLGGALSLVYDPQGDYTFELTGGAHAMSGDLLVRRGTLMITGGTFANVKSVKVLDGASIRLDSDDATATVFPSLTALELGANARFEIADGETTAFASGKVALVAGAGARLSVPTGVAVKFTSVWAAGVQATNATYGASTPASWLEGGGTAEVTVSDATITMWKAAADGDWSVAANWTRGVPTASLKARISAEGADYAVRIAEPTALPAKLNLTILNARGSGTPTLSLASDVSFDRAWMTIGPQARVDVPAGGNVVYRGLNGTAKTTEYSSQNVVQLVNGGEWRVSGGTCVFTNFYGRFSVGSGGEASSVTSRLSVVSGSLAVVSPDLQNRLDVHANGLVDISGGSGAFYQTSATTYGMIRMDGGLVRVRGTGQLAKGCVGDTTFNNFMSGDYVFEDESVCPRGVYFNLLGLNGEPLTVSFADDARITGSGIRDCSLEGLSAGTHVALNYDSRATSDQFYALYVGKTAGVCEFSQSAGAFSLVSVGLCVGQTTALAQNCPTGLVRITGGTFSVSGNGATETTFGHGADRPLGVVIGQGGLTDFSGSRRLVGRLDVSGGTITNEYGNFIVGLGPACGTVVQTGGEIHSGTKLAATYRTIGASAVNMIVGCGGGLGEYIVSNGTTTAWQNVYVGGALTNVMRLSRTGLSAKYPVGRHDAVGTLAVVGGTFEAKDSLIVGADGCGALSVGADGAIAVGKDLVLSNATSSAVSFTAGTDGLGGVTVGGRLVIADGAKLNVDLSACTLDRGRWSLIRAPEVAGRFAATDITLLAPERLRSRVRLVQGSTGVRVSLAEGFVLIVR